MLYRFGSTIINPALITYYRPITRPNGSLVDGELGFAGGTVMRLNDNRSGEVSLHNWLMAQAVTPPTQAD